MAGSPNLTRRKFDGDIDFSKGQNTYMDPENLTPGEYRKGYNVIARGSSLGTRPGFTPRVTLGCGRAQGMWPFRPTNGKLHLVAARSGKIYIIPEPFEAAYQLPNIQFNPYVDQIVFKDALVSQVPSGQTINPYAVLMMQDGMGRAAYWDGNISRHLDPTPDAFYNPASIGAKETIIGLWMEWVGFRLWVSNGRAVYASDIGDPLHFIETTYLSTASGFQAMDGDIIRGLKRTADAKTLCVFTDGNVTSIQAGNTVRSSWSTSQDFISLLFPGVGACSGKGICDVNGELQWMSREGWRTFNSVGSSVFTSRRPISSHEMDEDFNRIAPVTERICSGGFGSYSVVAVPVGDQYNRHMWIQDTSASDLLASRADLLNDKSARWDSIWTGIRPVEFANVSSNGENRFFALSQDRDQVRVWEMFMKDKKDNGNRITCFFDSRGYNGNEALTYKSIKYADLYLKSIMGQVSVQSYFKNDFGCWGKWMDLDLCAQECSEYDEDGCQLKNIPQDQRRHLKTKNAKADITSNSNVGGSRYNNTIGNFFQCRVFWQGDMSIWALKMNTDQWEEPNVGDATGGDAECVAMPCCDPEPDYWSIEDQTPVNYYSNGECNIYSI